MPKVRHYIKSNQAFATDLSGFVEIDWNTDTDRKFLPNSHKQEWDPISLAYTAKDQGFYLAGDEWSKRGPYAYEWLTYHSTGNTKLYEQAIKILSAMIARGAFQTSYGGPTSKVADDRKDQNLINL